MMTEEEKQKKLDRNPTIKRFARSKDFSKCGRLVSMAYQLHSIANSFTEEATEIMGKYGLMRFETKLLDTRLTKAFDNYHRHVNEMFTTQDVKEAVCCDFENLEKFCRKYMRIDDDDRGEIKGNES